MVVRHPHLDRRATRTRRLVLDSSRIDDCSARPPRPAHAKKPVRRTPVSGPLEGSGADIGDAADAFHYVWGSSQDDIICMARVASETGTHASAKAGVMIRERTGR